MANETLYESKDVYYKSDYILQIEYNCTDSLHYSFQYSFDFGLNWFNISNENQLQFLPIQFQSFNGTFYRLTISFHLLSNQNSSVRIRLRFSSKCSNYPLMYFYIGNKCPMNCFGNTYCSKGECQTSNSILPIVCRLI